MSSAKTLQQSIANTLAYFDLADYPLTKEELFGWLWLPPTLSYAEFLRLVETAPSPSSAEEGKCEPSTLQRRGQGEVLSVSSKFGYYFLLGRESIVKERRRKFLISEKKLRIARLAIRIIKSVPFLRAVFVCNTVASEQADDGSDIDFFIITEKNRIWITRLLVTFLLELFRLRRSGQRVKNKVCLSFYVTTESLDLAKFRVADDDIHFAYWLNQMLPIFDPDNFYAKFLQANSWTKMYLPNVEPNQVSSYLLKIPESWLGKLWKKAWERMWQGKYGDMIDNQAKQIQLSKMKFSGKSVDRGEDKGVAISDQVLKFHEKDTRLDYLEAWKEKIQYVEKSI